jgi:hypothetical protein
MSEILARKFHESYERLAPAFGYDTRNETRTFDPHSANGRLMIAVCAEVVGCVEGLERERDKWRECAELFVNSLCRPKGDSPTAKAFAEFERLKGETK